jgi:hypothetical protein
MKKLKLKALSLGAREILSREQLRQINGGSTPSYGCCQWYGGCGGYVEATAHCVCDGYDEGCMNWGSCYARSATGCF